MNFSHSQLNDCMRLLPVYFRFYRMLKFSFSKICIAPKAVKFQGDYLETFFTNLVAEIDLEPFVS